MLVEDRGAGKAHGWRSPVRVATIHQGQHGGWEGRHVRHWTRATGSRERSPHYHRRVSLLFRSV